MNMGVIWALRVLGIVVLICAYLAARSTMNRSE